MAQYRNAAQFYQKNSVQTASPAKIILMLYDGAIKFCHMAQDRKSTRLNSSHAR